MNDEISPEKAQNYTKSLKNHAKVLKSYERIHKIQDILKIHDNSTFMKQNEYSFNYFRAKVYFS